MVQNPYSKRMRFKLYTIGPITFCEVSPVLGQPHPPQQSTWTASLIDLENVNDGKTEKKRTRTEIINLKRLRRRKRGEKGEWPRHLRSRPSALMSNTENVYFDVYIKVNIFTSAIRYFLFIVTNSLSLGQLLNKKAKTRRKDNN